MNVLFWDLGLIRRAVTLAARRFDTNLEPTPSQYRRVAGDAASAIATTFGSGKTFSGHALSQSLTYYDSSSTQLSANAVVVAFAQDASL